MDLLKWIAAFMGSLFLFGMLFSALIQFVEWWNGGVTVLFGIGRGR